MGSERFSLVRSLRRLLADLDRLPPEERAARRQAWLAQIRRGRGDGNG